MACGFAAARGGRCAGRSRWPGYLPGNRPAHLPGQTRLPALLTARQADRPCFMKPPFWSRPAGRTRRGPIPGTPSRGNTWAGECPRQARPGRFGYKHHATPPIRHGVSTMQRYGKPSRLGLSVRRVPGAWQLGPARAWNSLLHRLPRAWHEARGECSPPPIDRNPVFGPVFDAAARRSFLRTRITGPLAGVAVVSGSARRRRHRVRIVVVVPARNTAASAVPNTGWGHPLRTAAYGEPSRRAGLPS